MNVSESARAATAVDDDADELDAQRRWAEQVADRVAARRVLATLPYTKVPFWLRAVDTHAFVRGRPWQARLGWPTLRFILTLLWRAPSYELVLLTGGERRDLVYAALAGLCPWVRTPHVIVDAHWQRADGWRFALQRLLLRLSRRLVVQVQPHSVEEEDLYHRFFGIPRRLLRAIPWSTSLIGFEAAPAPAADEPPFVLTGGLSFRDYGVFLAAARRTGVRVKIGLPAAGVTAALRAQIAQCPNVFLHTGWSNADYVREMQRCRAFAMPIAQGLTRATADQTILNAMHFGKLVVATDSIGPRIYLRDGVNGVLVREATPDAWAVALERAMGLPAADHARITAQAQHDARVVFNEPLRLARTLALALDAIAPADSAEDARFHHVGWADVAPAAPRGPRPR